jgi:hypothetical protein
MDSKTVYRVHKWFAVVVGAFTFTWFISGAVMLLPGRWLTLAPRVALGPEAEARMPGPAFDETTVLPAAAISAVSASVGKPVRASAVKLRRLPGQLVWEVTAENGAGYFVDAIGGRIFTINEDVAKQIVVASLGTDPGLGAVTRLGDAAVGYSGSLPAFAVPLHDGTGTVFYVDPSTGDVATSDYLSRVTRPLMGLHGLGFLHPILPPSGVRIVMLVLASCGTVLALSGAVILLWQLRRSVRRGRASV